MRPRGAPGVQVTLAVEGRIVVDRAVGRAGPGRALDAVTPMQAGSVAKLVTALVVHRLAADAALALDEDVRSAVPAAPPGPPVTVGDALAHLSGVRRRGYLGTVRRGMDEAGAPSALVRRRARRALRRVPGPGSFRYSGGGYLAVQAFVEQRTGRGLGDLADEFVLAPAGMTRSGLGVRPPAPPATGHVRGLPFPGGHLRLRELAAAGLWSTAGDLVRLGLALGPTGVLADAGRVVSEPIAPTGDPPPLAAVGRGVFLDRSLGDPVAPAWLCHPGRTVGFAAWLWARLDGTVVVAATANGMPGGGRACWAAAEATCREADVQFQRE